MQGPDTNEDAATEDAGTLGLRALVWTLAEPERAIRLLSITGIAPADLRTRISEPPVIAAALGFLEAHEPDLIACAAAIGVKPGDLVAARTALEA